MSCFLSHRQEFCVVGKGSSGAKPPYLKFARGKGSSS